MLFQGEKIDLPDLSETVVTVSVDSVTKGILYDQMNLGP